jgi:hypothetical protein
MIFGTNAIARVACILAHKPEFLFVFGVKAPRGPVPPHCRGFTITLRHTTVGRTPLDE